MLIPCFSSRLTLQPVFKMSAFVMHVLNGRPHSSVAAAAVSIVQCGRRKILYVQSMVTM